MSTNPSTDPSYTLTPQETASAISWGRFVALKSIWNGREDNHGQPLKGEPGIDISVEGSCSESALGKIVKFPWIALVDVGKAPDLAGNIQVRSTKWVLKGSLIVRPEGKNPDNLDHAYVLMLGYRPIYRCAGWIWGYEAMQLGEWRDPAGRGGPGLSHMPNYGPSGPSRS